MEDLRETSPVRDGYTRYNELLFDADFLTAVRDDGESVRFTRQERAILSAMAARPGRLLARERLLAAIAGECSGVTDRQVDFVVNRLRRKLKDVARAPRFIATQYGEGYVWIADARRAGRTVLVVLGPVCGLELLPSGGPVRLGLERLHRRMRDLCVAGEEVAFDPDRRPREAGDPDCRFAVRVDLHEEGGSIQAAFTLTDEVRGRPLRILHRTLAPGSAPSALPEAADVLIDALWRGTVRGAGEILQPGAAPLELRMERAALALSASREAGWRYLAAHARRAVERDPTDNEAALMLAACLFAQRIFAVDFDGSDADAYQAAGDEIERLALGALSRGCQEPLLRLTAARLLFGLHRGHLALVRQVLADTLASSAAFAAGLSLAGLLKTSRGDLPGAVGSYDQALALCEPATEFEIYLQRRKAEALVAAGDRASATACLDRALSLRPRDPLLHLLRLDPGRAPDRIAAEALAAWTPRLARQVMGRLMFGVARNFSRPEHVDALLAGPLRHALDRFGPEALPEPARRTA